MAERTGIPNAQVAISVASFEAFIRPLADGPLRRLGSARGSAGLLAAPRLTLVPASLDDEGGHPARAIHRFRYSAAVDATAELPPDWWPNSRAPLIYVTFGSVAASMGFFPDFYRAMLVALSGLPVRVLLTLGMERRPLRVLEAVAAQPGRVDRADVDR